LKTAEKTKEDVTEKLLKTHADLLPFKKGDTAEGILLSKTRNRVWIEIEGRGIGMVPPREIPAEIEDLNPGDKVMAFVMEPEDDKGHIILSLKRADRDRVWLNLKRKFEDQEDLSVKVVEANKGGLMVESAGVRGFLPLSQLSSDHYPRVDGGDKGKIYEKLQQLVGLKTDVKIISFDQQANKLIFSEKKVASKVEKEKISSVKVGQSIAGTVSGVVDFGLFIRFPIPDDKTKECEGLVHISEISWGKVSDIRKEFKVGDKIKAEVISIDDNRISLSMKRLLPDPWIKKIKNYKMGQKVKGTVIKVTPFGAFVELEKDIEGLVHISEIGNGEIVDPREVLNENDKKEFEIISIEPESHKIGLRLKKIK
jgi:small subunit ribosomal protein S1